MMDMRCKPMLLLIALAVTPAVAADGAGERPVELLTPDRVEFQPDHGEEVVIPVRTTEAGEVTLRIMSGDDDVVRRLGPRALEPGRHEWTWDGRDDAGDIVADEAYVPVAVCDCAGDRFEHDPRASSGGEIISGLDVEWSADTSIRYRLPRPARVLVRVGIESGAMAQTLAAWEPRAAGVVREHWDGTAAGSDARLDQHPRRTALVRAFALPDHVLITSGNDAIDYPAYRRKRDWPVAEFSPQAAPEPRNGKRMSHHSAMPASVLRDPEPRIRIIDGVTDERDGVPVITEGATFRVDMPERDRWLMEQSRYEVGFFLDFEFVAEEETGYTPLTWRWGGTDEPGVHAMTVNVIGLWGRVGSDTVRFRVPADAGNE